MSGLALRLLAIGLAALGLGFLVHQHREISRLEETVERQKAEAAAQLVDLQGCQGVRDQLRAANGELLTELRTGTENMEQARFALDKLSAQILRESQNVRRERTVIYREPSCRELADLDLAAVCPDLAVSLRARAAQMSAPRADRGGGAGSTRTAIDR